MANKLFVANLSYSMTEDTLKTLFEEYGAVEAVKIITDKLTGRSRGFGFVEMVSKEDATAVIEKLNGHEQDGRTLKVDWAKAKQEGSSRFGGRSGGFGGNGGGNSRY